tara:strand:+ start:159 stop:299 length:141 start_codon:yes stop_codon:yes gene_type:complete
MLDIVSSLEKEDFQKDFTKALTVVRGRKIIKKMFIELIFDIKKNKN